MMCGDKRDFRDYKRRGFSASDDGRGIQIGSIGSPGTLIHTAINSTANNEWDAIWLQAVNTSVSAVKLTVEWGGTSAADRIEMSIPAGSGLVEVIPGLVLQNDAEVRAFAETADVVIVHGYVDRYEISRF